jgi:pimeloyl-ACP methyl ester carboxylesterase
MRRFSFLPCLLLLLVSAPLSLEAEEPSRGLRFEKHGSGDRTLILIPGLACGASVWEDTIAQLKKDYRIYAVTLAGFDGVAPVKPPVGDAWLQAFVRLIEDENLDRPVIVGHSLGGNLALRLAARYPRRVGAVIAVDSLPIFPPLEPGESLETRRTQMALVTTLMQFASKEQFALQAEQAARFLVTDPEHAKRVKEMMLNSDRATYTGAVLDLATTDVRPELKKIEVPVTVLIPVWPQKAQEGDPPPTEGDLRKIYGDAFAGTPDLQLEVIADSRHFIMFDQPERFHEVLRRALERSHKAR